MINIIIKPTKIKKLESRTQELKREQKFNNQNPLKVKLINSIR